MGIILLYGAFNLRVTSSALVAGSYFVRKTKEMSGEGPSADGLMPAAREHLERIAIEIIGIASECDNSSATQQRLMQLVEQISKILDE